LAGVNVGAGYYPPERAATDYAVIVSADGEVDLAATERLRAERRAPRPPA